MSSNSLKFVRGAITIAVLLAFLPANAQTQGPSGNERVAAQQRLKIGVALSGGGARGIAHVGVLEWFEKNRIPIDYITGTSMGGLVGAIYAMGMEPQEMRPFLKSLNWDELLGSGPSFEQLSLRRKEDRRNLQVGLELGYRKGLKLPLGISSAHFIGLLIDRLTLPYYSIRTFDELPVPYRCVATDFLEAKSLVLKDGSLASAMRATMSIPGVFPPVERDGKVLVDGGLINNIPTDVIREFKPDVTIAVDVGTKPGDMRTISSLAGILQQSILVMTIENDRRNLRLADIIIAPELGDLSLLDFSAIDKVADIGYQTAEAKAAVLTKFSLSESEWQEYTAERRARRRTSIPIPTALRIRGVNEAAQKNLGKYLDDFVDREFDLARLDATLTKITGQGRYESLNYAILPDQSDQSKCILEIIAKEKSYAPPTINFGVEVDGSDVNAINFTVGSRVTFYDVLRPKDEWRNDLKLGFDNLFATEYFRPIGEGGVFIAPRAAYRSERQGFFTGRTRIAEYQIDRYSAGLDLGYLRERSELRVGYELTRVDARSRTGAADLPVIIGNVNQVRMRFAFDGQNSSTIPTHGLRFTADGRWLLTTPGASGGLPRAEIRSSYFTPITSRGTVFGAISGGSYFNRRAPAFQQFLLGGPFNFGVDERDELRVNHYFLASAGYLHKLYQLSPIIGGNIYATAWFDQLGGFGGVTSLFDSQRYRAAISSGLVMDTKFGPFSIIGSYGEGGRSKIYFALGRLF